MPPMRFFEKPLRFKLYSIFMPQLSQDIREMLDKLGFDSKYQDLVFDYIESVSFFKDESFDSLQTHLIRFRKLNFTGETISQTKKFEEVARRFDLHYSSGKESRGYVGIFRTSTAVPVAQIVAYETGNRYKRYEQPRLETSRWIRENKEFLIYVVMAMKEYFYKSPESFESKFSKDSVFTSSEL